MAGERIFKRRIEFDFDAYEKRQSREIVLRQMATMYDEEKQAWFASLPDDIQKAMRNEFLLAQATANVPTAEDGLFATVHRTGRRITAT